MFLQDQISVDGFFLSFFLLIFLDNFGLLISERKSLSQSSGGSCSDSIGYQVALVGTSSSPNLQLQQWTLRLDLRHRLG